MNGYSFSLAIVALLLISAFFSASEIALTASKRTKLQVLLDHGERRAIRVMALKEEPGNFFTVVQVGVNAVAVLGGVLSEGFLNGALRDAAAPWFSLETAAHVGNVGAFLIVTTLFILLADLLPKRLAMIQPERTALRIIDPLLLAIRLFRPFVWFFNGMANAILRFFKLPTRHIDVITSEDITAIVDAGAEAGVLRKQEFHLIENIFELESKSISSVMTYRDDVVYFTTTEDEKSIRHKLIETPHSKFPVCRDDIDNVLGYVDSKDLLQRIAGDDPGSVFRGLDKSYTKSLLVIPDTLNLSEALAKFKEARENFAVVINEYGLMVGVVTLNDIVGAVMGSMIYPPDEEQIVKRDAQSWLVDGVTPIDDVKKALDIEELPGEGNYDTIAGFMIYSLKRIPKKSESIEAVGFKFEVVDIDNYKIDQLLVSKQNVSQSLA